MWLREKHSIDTGNVDLVAVPESQKPKMERSAVKEEGGSKIKIGLLAAWDLIAAFTDDPLVRGSPPNGAASCNS